MADNKERTTLIGYSQDTEGRVRVKVGDVIWFGHWSSAKTVTILAISPAGKIAYDMTEKATKKMVDGTWKYERKEVPNWKDTSEFSVKPRREFLDGMYRNLKSYEDSIRNEKVHIENMTKQIEKWEAENPDLLARIELAKLEKQQEVK